MIQLRFPLAATLVLLAACQSDPENAATSKKPVPEPAKTPHSVPAAPIMSKPQAPAKPTADAAAPDTSPAGRLATVKQDYEDAMQAYFELFKGAKTDEDYEAISKTAKRPEVDTYRARARAIIDEDPASPVALDAITWMLTEARGGDDQAELLAIVEKHHMQSEKLTELARGLASDSTNGGKEFVQKVLETSPSADVRGTALYSLANAMQREIEAAKRVQSATAEDLEKMFTRGGEMSGRLKSLDVPAQEKQVDALLERTVKEFPDVVYGKSTLGERAGADLFEKKNLIVGKLAPDIAGEDLDGANFKLADYRGKIVLLDFWGNW